LCTHCSRLNLQREARRRLAAENNWHAGPLPDNMQAAASPAHVKELLLGTPQGQLVVVDFFTPSCHGCRTMFPKLKQIAAAHPDVCFVAVDASRPELGDLARDLGVTKLPWFQIFRGGGGGEVLASFTANLSTISVLRDEIAGLKECHLNEASCYGR
jgi:thiol-disulfide isomerase/thioredoxin